MPARSKPGGRIDEAIKEYSAVSGYFPGVEARYRLALCFKAAGKEPAARAEFESILNDAKLAPAAFPQKPEDLAGCRQERSGIKRVNPAGRGENNCPPRAFLV